jgi:GNAT superfamily N-acetyltransferase
MQVEFRPGTLADSFSVYKIFLETLIHLSERMGAPAISGGNDPNVVARLWENRRGLFEHLARTASQFWIAEVDGKPAGYARAIKRDGVSELTEYFVLPDFQQGGLGRELLNRTYLDHLTDVGIIVATQDAAALARYIKAGFTPRFPATYFFRHPELVPLETDLKFVPVTATVETLETINEIDLALFGHTRQVDHTWLLEDRQGYLLLRRDRAVGYGYVGESNGPIALLNPADFPAVLAFAERQVYGKLDKVGFEVPLINQQAVQYLLGAGYRMDGFMTQFLSTAPFGKFENYIYTGPPFFY